MNSPLLQVVGGGGGINFAVRWEEVLPHFFSSTILNTFPLTFFWQHRIQMRRLSLINALPINFPFRPREKLLIFLNSILQILVLWTTNPQFYIQLLYTAPLCFTLTISDQKIVSGSLFFLLFSTFCGQKNFFFIKELLCKFFMRLLKYFCPQKVEKTTQKSCIL